MFLETHAFDWVTKAKRNTALYRRVMERSRERFVPVSPRQLIKEAYKQLIVGSGLSAVALSDIYMKIPYETLGRKGQTVTKHHYVPIAAVAAIRLKEDEEAVSERDKDDDPAIYKGAYLIISNLHDAPKEALAVYGKRWRIGVSS